MQLSLLLHLCFSSDWISFRIISNFCLEMVHGLGKRELIHFPGQCDHISMLIAPKAVEISLVGIDVKGWSLVVVKRAVAPESVPDLFKIEA